MTDKESNEKGVAEYTLWERESALERIANMALCMMDPGTIKQADDNLLGMARLVLSACARFDIKV